MDKRLTPTHALSASPIRPIIASLNLPLHGAPRRTRINSPSPSTDGPLMTPKAKLGAAVTILCD
jgi:hypothetical protein